VHGLSRRPQCGRAPDRSSDRSGPPAGVPFLIKARPPPDAPIVARLVADAILIGTSLRARSDAVCQTFGWNARNYTRNSSRLDRSPDGSSACTAGSVAAGVVPLATGVYTAGSLRIPASFSGVIGLKSTRGRVPPSTLGRPGRLTVAGIIGADLADVALATSIAAGNAVDIPAAPLMDRSG
jgi:amidase